MFHKGSNDNETLAGALCDIFLFYFENMFEIRNDQKCTKEVCINPHVDPHMYTMREEWDMAYILCEFDPHQGQVSTILSTGPESHIPSVAFKMAAIYHYM